MRCNKTHEPHYGTVEIFVGRFGKQPSEGSQVQSYVIVLEARLSTFYALLSRMALWTPAPRRVFQKVLRNAWAEGVLLFLGKPGASA